MQSRNPSGWLVRCLFKVALWILGKGMELACRFSTSFRGQLTRDVIIQVGSADGVSQYYVCGPRTLKSYSGPSTDPSIKTLALTFDNAWLALVTLLLPGACGGINRALLDYRAVYEGNAVLLLWFWPLTRYVLPYDKVRPLRQALPDGYIAPSDDVKVASQITREPVATELDPTWKLARERRSQMAMLREANGEDVPFW